MEAIILILIIGPFAWWCFAQASKPREKSELEKQKEADAWSEDMHRRYKDVEPPPDWSKTITPSAKSTARSQASRPLSDPTSNSTKTVINSGTVGYQPRFARLVRVWGP